VELALPAAEVELPALAFVPAAPALLLAVPALLLAVPALPVPSLGSELPVSEQPAINAEQHTKYPGNARNLTVLIPTPAAKARSAARENKIPAPTGMSKQNRTKESEILKSE
jgi:hypothetical protein